jgi:hypothetical protein
VILALLTVRALAADPAHDPFADAGLGAPPIKLRIAESSLRADDPAAAARYVCPIVDDAEVGAAARELLAETRFACDALPPPPAPPPEGAMERADIDKVIKKRMAWIRYCYQRELTADPTVTGKVVEHFVIGADGRVDGATSVAEPAGGRMGAVGACVDDVFVERMRFPQPSGGVIVIVKYPFDFEPR